MIVPGCLQPPSCHLFCNTIALFITKFLCCGAAVVIVFVAVAVAVGVVKNPSKSKKTKQHVCV